MNEHRHRSGARSAALGFMVFAALAGGAGRAADISVTVSMGNRGVVEDLGNAFGKATGNTVHYVQGGGGGALPDVLIGSPDSIDAGIAKGEVLAGSRVDWARVGVGLSVRAGAPKPDISTPEKFKRAMLDAQSIGHASASVGSKGSGRITLDAFEKIGITEQVSSRTKWIDGTPVAEIVAKGEVQYGLQQINVLRPVAGADYVGPLPGNLQAYVPFAMGIASTSKQPEVARAFTRFAVSPAGVAIVIRDYLEPWPASASSGK